MKHLAKLVTGILLITLSALPAFAAIPCQQSVRPMSCCDGTLCPMMAKMASKRAVIQGGMKNTPAPCCTMHARSIVAVTDHQSIDTPAANAIRGAASAMLLAPIPQSHQDDVIVVNDRHGQRTQAILSTFLI